MIELLIDYVSFFAKTLTVVLAIGVVLIIVLASASRRSRESAEQLQIKPLNQRYDSMRTMLQQAILPKNELKRLKKERANQQKRKRKEGTASERRRVFVIDFEGDIRASGIDSLREEVTAILTLARPQDEVVVRLENAGGVVHGHGLGASQLVRIRDRNIPLTVAIDKVAASGGYMMACVANTIISAPFAIIGSIGVLVQLPNFHRLLKRYGIDFEQIMAGEYKRTVTLFGENSEEDREKLQSEIDRIHSEFKDFIMQHRSELDIARVATGEHWHGKVAQELGLVDQITTSDDYLLDASEDADLYQVTYTVKTGLIEKLGAMLSQAALRILERLSGLAR